MPVSHWPRDNTRDCIAFYGDPRGSNGEGSPAWINANLRSVVPKFRIVAAWAPDQEIHSFRMHRLCYAAAQRVFDKIWDAYGRDQKRIEADRVHLFGGSYNFRVKRGLTSLSVHAFGAAIDIDPLHNALGARNGTMPRAVIEAFKSEGAVWGGDWEGRPDPMHFQFAQ